MATNTARCRPGKSGKCSHPVLLVLCSSLLPSFVHPSTMAAATVEEIRANAYVGFDTITQQIEHKLLKRGFQFNVIVVGASTRFASCSAPYSLQIHDM